MSATHAPAGTSHARGPDVTRQAPTRCGCSVTGSAEGPPVQLHGDLCRLRQFIETFTYWHDVLVGDLAQAQAAVERGDLDAYRAAMAAAAIHRAKSARAIGGSR